MFESLFGAEMPLPVRFFIAFLIVLGLIGVTAWVVRRFGAERLGAGGRMDRRHPRLAVIDAAAVDGRRRLILIRRDNVEHLLMIGGPSDVVIEPNIVRAAAASARDSAPPARPASSTDPLPRAVALGDAGNWPLQPEPAPAARPSRLPAVEETSSWPAEPEFPPTPSPPPRRQARVVDPLAGLAAELGRNGEPRVPMPGDAPGGLLPREPRMREPARERDVQIEREPMRERESAREPRDREPPIREREPAREREAAREREPAREPVRLREPQPLPAPAPAPEAQEEFNAEADQNLADMAQRLEAALRRPAKAADGRSGEAAAPRAITASADSVPAIARVATAGAEASAVPKPGKSLYDSLEKEMASLLGRPGGKA